MYQEYEKSVNNLTISEKCRLKSKIKEFESEKSQIELLEIKYSLQMREMRKELQPLLELKSTLIKEGILEVS